MLPFCSVFKTIIAELQACYLKKKKKSKLGCETHPILPTNGNLIPQVLGMVGKPTEFMAIFPAPHPVFVLRTGDNYFWPMPWDSLSLSTSS